MMPKIFPMFIDLGRYLKMGMDHYADLRSVQGAVDPQLVSAYLRVKIDKWEPEVNGRKILDASTKDAGARFIAGLACNLAGLA
jgi:hypothetical protein